MTSTRISHAALASLDPDARDRWQQGARRQVDADLAVVGGHLDASVDPQRLLITGSVLASGLPRLLEVLAEHTVPFVAVLRQGQLAGLITRSDIMRILLH